MEPQKAGMQRNTVRFRKRGRGSVSLIAEHRHSTPGSLRTKLVGSTRLRPESEPLAARRQRDRRAGAPPRDRLSRTARSRFDHPGCARFVRARASRARSLLRSARSRPSGRASRSGIDEGPAVSTIAQYSLTTFRPRNCDDSRRAAFGVLAQINTPEVGRSSRCTIPTKTDPGFCTSRYFRAAVSRVSSPAGAHVPWVNCPGGLTRARQWPSSKRMSSCGFTAHSGRHVKRDRARPEVTGTSSHDRGPHKRQHSPRIKGSFPRLLADCRSGWRSGRHRGWSPGAACHTSIRLRAESPALGSAPGELGVTPVVYMPLAPAVLGRGSELNPTVGGVPPVVE